MLLTGVGNHAAAQSNEESANAFLHMVEVCSTIKDSSQYWRNEAKKAGWEPIGPDQKEYIAEIVGMEKLLSWYINSAKELPPKDAFLNAKATVQQDIDITINSKSPQFYFAYKGDTTLAAFISPAFYNGSPLSSATCRLFHMSAPNIPTFEFAAMESYENVYEFQYPENPPLFSISTASQSSPEDLSSIYGVRWTPLDTKKMQDHFGKAGTMTAWKIWRPVSLSDIMNTQPSEKVTP